eukprot:Nitzschia sp. Nitz4//scaffold15_size197535//88132//91644//NITZ4_001579-RA/size197535-processed-gene-0.70-mRNA-1//-1//CDS//3329537718//9322//frame0
MEALEQETQHAVECIRLVIESLRTIFPSSDSPIPLYSLLLQQDSVLQQVASRNPTQLPTISSDQRTLLVHNLLWTLLENLATSFEKLDQQLSSQPKPSAPSPTTTHSKRRQRPTPPPGLLSIQNYTDIACFLEFVVYTSILPTLPPHVLPAPNQRLAHNLPKSLAGRIPRASLLWACSPAVCGTSIPVSEWIGTVERITQVVSLDRFRPMLMPRHLPDVYAALFYYEHLSPQGSPVASMDMNHLYSLLGLVPPDRATVSNPEATSSVLPVVEHTLQARVYQTLLLQGTKAPAWIKRRINPLLTNLASKDLPSVVQVFGPNSMAAQRLGQTLARQSEHGVQDQLLSHILQLLTLMPRMNMDEKESQGMARSAVSILQTIWAIVLEWPEQTFVSKIVSVWETSLIQGGSSLSKTVRQLNALCAIVVISNTTDPWMRLLRHVVASKTIFPQLLRLSCIQTVNSTCAVRTDARQTLQWLGHFLCTVDSTTWTGFDAPVSGPCCWAAVWIHALSCVPWDIEGNIYRMENESVQVCSQLPVTLEAIVKGIQQRADMWQGLFLSVGASDQDQNESREVSLLFQMLLQLYLSADGSERSNYKLVSTVLLPLLGESCSPEALLFGSSGDALGLLRLIQSVLTCIPSGEQYNPESSKDQDPEVQSGFEILDTLLHLDGEEPSLDVDSTNDGDTLLSLASILLSLLIAVLELGSKLRSDPEEEAIRGFLPILSSLAQLNSVRSTDAPDAGIADMAGYALAMIASRSANVLGETSISKPDDPLHDLLIEAERDLGSSQVPLRARAMVTLGRLARGYTGIIPEKKAPLIVEVNELSDKDSKQELVNQVLRLSMTALSDSESYVYLAAVQTIVAIGDMIPVQVLPLVSAAVVSGRLSIPTGTLGEEHVIELSQEQQIKLAEALMFMIRRRATPESFVPILVNQMLFGVKSQRIKCTSVSKEGEYAIETHNYFVQTEESSMPKDSAKERLEAQDIRIRTGGPVFTGETSDVVESIRVSVLAELVSVTAVHALVPFCGFFLRTLMDVMRLETSRALTRAGALLARELYSAVLREFNDGQSDMSTRVMPVTLATAMVEADEEALATTLESYVLQGSTKGGVLDPATEARCREALELRGEATEEGIFAAALVLRSQSESLEMVPSILTSMTSTNFSDAEAPFVVPRED